MMDNVSRNRFGRLTVELLDGQGRLDPASLNTGHPPVIRPAARLLRCATALRVTAPLGCGSRRLVWPKGSLSARPHGPPPPFPSREQRVSPDRPAAVQGAKRRSEPLTARTDLESLQARGKGG